MDQASAMDFVFPLVYIPPKNKKQNTIINSNICFFRSLFKLIVSTLNRYIWETRFNKYRESNPSLVPIVDILYSIPCNAILKRSFVRRPTSIFKSFGSP